MSDDDEEDPFEHLSAPEDADPFSELDGPDEHGAPDEGDRQDDEHRETDPARGDDSPSGGDEPGPGRMPDDPFTAREESGGADGDTFEDDWGAPGEAGPDASGDRDPGSDDSFDRMEGATGPTEVDDPPRTGDQTGDATGTDGPRDAGTDDPLSTMDEGESGADEDDPFAAFESVEIEGEFDPDQVWQTLADVESEGRAAPGEKVYYEVSKHRFCERCEHFSGPPETTCTYEGAEIVEFLDMETVRLVNCPVVAEYRQLGDDGTMD